MTGVLLRIRNILLRPAREWQVIKEERTTPKEILLRHVAALAAVPPVCAVLDRILFGGRIAGSQPLGYVVTTNLVWYLVIIANIVITSVVFTAIIASSEHRRMEREGLQLAAYSFTPLFLVPVVMIAPRLSWMIYLTIVYSVYLLTLGIRALTTAGKGRAAWLAAVSVALVATIVGILNGLEYMLESFVLEKAFS